MLSAGHKQYHDNILGVSGKALGFLYAFIIPLGY